MRITISDSSRSSNIGRNTNRDEVKRQVVKWFNCSLIKTIRKLFLKHYHCKKYSFTIHMGKKLTHMM